MSPVPTIKIKPWSSDQGAFVLINETDFDPGRHELFEAPVAEPEPVSPDEPSDAEMRAAIKAATGKAPGPRTSHDELVRQFNEIEG